MKIRIEYCVICHYAPRALRARDLIMAKILDADIELIGSGGGVFNIDVDGHRTYCKSNTGRFPTDDEILNVIS